jgi:hypothetical protein
MSGKNKKRGRGLPDFSFIVGGVLVANSCTEGVESGIR